MIDNPQLRKRIERILELPALIDAEGRKLAGLRSDKRVQERKIKAREALLRKELMELEEYQACKNADERAALFEDSKHTDMDWTGLTERFEQLVSMTEHATNRKDVLDHERRRSKPLWSANTPKSSCTPWTTGRWRTR